MGNIYRGKSWPFQTSLYDIMDININVNISTSKMWAAVQILAPPIPMRLNDEIYFPRHF